MPDNNVSSKKLLEGLSEATEIQINAGAVREMDREIEKRMEWFDMKKRQKAARAVEDLGRFVITA